ncbi:DUF262 domain-containing protein [Bradyrhizobium diazoefficiens]|nr:DUF262 domain-containing protein [Bradyrhizobium diazoefficiens]MBR0925735.1 DUF262 domain-containing protein [Bradyrhizobium diazoefficiens]
MSYSSETIQAILPRLNSTYFLPALQREFVWTEEQICQLFDSLMRGYPISSFLFWHVPIEGRDDVEAYEFLRTVKESRNRAALARVHGSRNLTFVLDGQQRLTSLLVGLQGHFHGRKAKSGKGSKTQVMKKLYLDLLHDGRIPDADGELGYSFEFFDYVPVLSKNSYWLEVGRILNAGADSLSALIERQIKSVRDIRPLPSQEASVVQHNLTRLHELIWSDEVISYHTETDSDPERILEIFVRVNSGGTELSKSDLLLSTLSLHWGAENAREVINNFVDELNNQLTRKNKLNKDFVMKSCLLLLNLPVAYRVSSFTKGTCGLIKAEWKEISDAIRKAVDAANAFGIDESTLTSANALIPVAFYLRQHPKVSLRGEGSVDVVNARRVRVWLLGALLNRILGGSSDSMLTKLREALQTHFRPNGDFPIASLDEAVKEAGRLALSSDDAVENVMNTQYGDNTCFLALSLLYDDRNWGTIEHSIDHLFAQEEFRKKWVPENIKDLRDDFANLALVIGNENSGKKDRPLHEWLSSRSDEYLKRHHIPSDPTL